MVVVTVLDYGVGNIGSVLNALKEREIEFRLVGEPNDITRAEKLLFPGVGHFGAAVEALKRLGYWEPLREYLAAGKPYLGVCIGMQLLFESSEEAPGVAGLCIVPGTIRAMVPDATARVPQIGWNSVDSDSKNSFVSMDHNKRFYFVHSYCALESDLPPDWQRAAVLHGAQRVAAVIGKGDIVATQFHPEKSGENGLSLLKRFAALRSIGNTAFQRTGKAWGVHCDRKGLSKRVIACLDVREDDNGKIVVTKGDQYDVRKHGSDGGVVDVGDPVHLAAKYYEQGVDELVFLDISAFRNRPVEASPMTRMLEEVSKRVFIPLTVGGGVADGVDANGAPRPADQVADLYFRSGADKVSLGSAAVAAVQALAARGGRPDGTSVIERLAATYGRQAVVVSVDPKRVYVASPADTPHETIRTARRSPEGLEHCFWVTTSQGGRTTHQDVDVIKLVKGCETLGAGEVLLNSIDNDGQNDGFDLDLLTLVRRHTALPIIVSSGAGRVAHFRQAFDGGADGALAAGIFHRGEVDIKDVKEELKETFPIRLSKGG